MTLVIAILASLAYLAGWVITTRWRYEATRPFTEPLNCHYSYICQSGHQRSCYRRNDQTLIDSANEALAYAVLFAVIWPLAILGFAALAIGRMVVGHRELPRERAARIKRLEREAGLGDR